MWRRQFYYGIYGKGRSRSHRHFPLSLILINVQKLLRHVSETNSRARFSHETYSQAVLTTKIDTLDGPLAG